MVYQFTIWGALFGCGMLSATIGYLAWCRE